MDGFFADATRLLYQGVAHVGRNVHGRTPLHRPKRALFSLLLTAILLLPLAFLPRLSARYASGAHFLRTAHAAALQTVAACQELLVNGDLEGSGGWNFGATPAPGTIVDTPVHAGSFAIRLGIAGSTNGVAYSTAYQTVTLPATAEQIVLTYWEQPGATGDSGDYREIVALRSDFTVRRSLERQTGSGNEQWAQRTFDLTDLRGQTLVLYFNVYNNGSGATLVNYLDDLSLQSCDSTTPATPTATATATPTPTTTAVVTPTVPAPIATATALPSNLIVRAGGVAVIEGQTAITVPLDLVGVAAEPAIGVLSVDVHYDTTVLKAVACAVSSSFDLLLCNMETPGLLQLAGVAANGLRTDLRVADLGFELLPPVNRTTQLTVQLDALADVDGTTLHAVGQNGQITITCRPGSEDCQTLFLPLVHR